MFEEGFPLGLFVNELDDTYHCSICRDILNDPVQCRSGHLFCRNCIKQWLAKHPNCPTCRESLSVNTLSDSLAIKSQINSKVVHCKTKVERIADGNDGNDACEWTGPLQDLWTHLSTCQHACCPHCHLQIVTDNFNNHVNECNDQPVKFTRQLFEQLSLNTLLMTRFDEHLESTDNNWLDATADLNRRLIATNRSYTELYCHFQSVVDENTSLTQRLQSAEQTVQQLANNLQIADDTVIQLTSRLETSDQIVIDLKNSLERVLQENIENREKFDKSVIEMSDKLQELISLNNLISSMKVLSSTYHI